MKVTYERLFNLGNYNNERIALEDDVRDGETPEEAYQRLRSTVYAMAGKPDPAQPKVEVSRAVIDMPDDHPF
jgi:hypothetical protein